MFLCIVINKNRNRRNAAVGSTKISHSSTCVLSFDSSIISIDNDQENIFREKRTSKDICMFKIKTQKYATCI